MTTEQKIEFISDCLTRWEDWMHGEDAVDVGQCRIYLDKVKSELERKRDTNIQQLAELGAYQAENERLKEAIATTIKILNP